MRNHVGSSSAICRAGVLGNSQDLTLNRGKEVKSVVLDLVSNPIHFNLNCISASSHTWQLYSLVRSHVDLVPPELVSLRTEDLHFT
jgi:hypothetical protein